MKDALDIIGFVAVAFFIFGFGILQAYWPINDKETSAIHRVITMSVTTLLIALLAWKWLLS